LITYYNVWECSLLMLQMEVKQASGVACRAISTVKRTQDMRVLSAK
jgi:hypothetical protein